MTKTIGIVTSGGDAPGMNAAIRAVTRVAHSKGFQVIGFERGWDGLLTNSFRKLDSTQRWRHNPARRHHTSHLRCPNSKKKEHRKSRRNTFDKQC